MTEAKKKPAEVGNEEFSEDNIPKDNWIKFPEVGNWFVGTYLSKKDRPAEGVYPAQVVYTINNVKYNGEQMPAADEWYVGVTIHEGKRNFINNRLKNMVPGIRFGIKFDKEIPNKDKNLHNAKSYMPNVFDMDPEYVSAEDAFGAGDIDVDEIPFES